MQTATTPKHSPALARTAGFFLFLSLATGVEGFLFAYRQEQATVASAKTAAQAERIRARLEGELGAVTMLGNGLASYWTIRRDFPAAETRDILAGLYPHSQHVRSFAAVVDYRVAYVFPQDDNGQAVGFDYRGQPGQWPLIRRSVETHTPVLAVAPPPTPGLAYWVPVYAGDKPLGVLSVLIDNASLFAAAGLTQAGDYQYALRAQKAPGQGGETILGADGLFGDPAAATTDIAVPGGHWRLAAKHATPPPTQPTAADVFRAFGWLFAGLFAIQSVALAGLKRKLSDLAFYDALTGLPSRHLFLDRLKQMIRRAKRNRGNFSVLFISLDGARPVHGRQIGDMMLAGIGKRLIGAIRHCDTVTRWGGSEFLILLDACPLDQAKLIAENLRHKIELPVSYGQRELRVGASIGLATYPEDGHSLTTLLKAADKRMLEDRGRRNGKPQESPPM